MAVIWTLMDHDLPRPTAKLHATLSFFVFVVAMLLSLRGAWSAETLATVPDVVENPITAEDRDHWAFQPIRQPQLPAVQQAHLCRTTIDRFVQSQLEAARLSPQPAADRTTLIRRVTFDLTGLPPTPEEIDAFLADKRSDAYDQLVDRLLASPAFGERWAQHWLDLARFAETDGFEHDAVRPNAWRYRDWVIDAINRDVPFDEFLRLQLAGDELRPDDAGAITATGFLLCGPDMPDLNLQEERRHNYLNDLTGTVGSILFGLQTGCAACHDHKYDPISQLDFYRLRAFFDPMEIFKDHPLPHRETQPIEPAHVELVARVKSLKSEIEQIEEDVGERLRAENPDLEPTPSILLRSLNEDERRRHRAANDEIAAIRKKHALPEEPLGRVVRETNAQVKASRLFLRGDFRRRGPEVIPAFLRVVNADKDAVRPLLPEVASTGRRTQLADWVTRPDNPLTARVIVNRIWQHHFGRGLVETASDFGKMGAEPTHPELLDWLAAELPRQGWSLKWLHREIVGSAAYQRASRPALGVSAEAVATRDAWRQAAERDSDNRLLWHRARLRLDGESIRDAVLAAGDRLNYERGGPGVRPPLPDELVSQLLKKQWGVSEREQDFYRRSIYLFVRRNLRYPLFEAFDRPDTNASCACRNRSTIAPQALILLNSELSLDAARDLAGLVYAQAKDDNADRVRLAYRRTLGREPTAAELATACQFLEQQAARLKASERRAGELAVPRPAPANGDSFAAAAFTDFCLALFNLNEFVYVD